MDSFIPSPCIGLCSTTLGDDICRGCSRFYNEVDQWNQYTDIQKKNVYSRIDSISVNVISQYIVVEDFEILREKVASILLPMLEYRPPIYQAFELIRRQPVYYFNPESIGVLILDKKESYDRFIMVVRSDLLKVSRELYEAQDS